MNTIKRPRQRPRVKSCSFKTLGWLIRREGAFCAIWGPAALERPSRLRREWAQLSTRFCDGYATHVIQADEFRRYYP